MNFGLVQPTLIQQIKKILDQYPDDGQILKELIQNAEDAKATEVKFLFDNKSYRTKRLVHSGLAQFQGPALYAYNDAKFSPDDWKGIGLLCDSIKEKDPTKVGRFGLGFKSVFHMTDLPSVISGDSLGIIDPHEKYFSNEDGKRSGRRWHLKRDKRIIQNFADQFAPYKGIFDCGDECFKRGSYNGTLFRLPLRLVGQKTCKLSKTVYSQEKMKGLFECFEKDAHLILLFLMNLERIEVYERDANSLEPRKLFHVGISNSCLSNVRKARLEFRANVEERISALSDGCFTEVKKTYSLTIETVHYHGSETQGRRLEHSFIVTLFFSGSDVSPEIKALIRDDSLSYLPLVGVALPLKQQVNKKDYGREDNIDMDDDSDEPEAMDYSEFENKRDTDPYVDNEPQGHLFCFLPLPLENKSLTGLPVHVNGFFALSQNRRHLKWPSADQDEAIQPLTDKSLLWNKGLLNEVLPKAYAELVLQATSRLPKENAYSAWPDVNHVNVKWRAILQPLFRILLKSKVLYSDANSGVWCKVDEVLLDDLGRNNQSGKIVIDVLNRADRKVVTVPVNVKTALQQHYPTIEYVTPRVLRCSLKANSSCYSNLSHKDKILLLMYVLSDSGFKNLKGIELLPLSDKTFTTFRRAGSDPIYIDSCEHPKSLLPKLQGMFLDTDIDTDITVKLKNAAKKGYTQLRLFDNKVVELHLQQTLPPEWLDSEDSVTWYPGTFYQPTVKWLKELWLYFGRHFGHTESALGVFNGLPLIPVTGTPSDQSEVQLARIQQPSSLVLASFNGESIDESVCQVLKSLGLTILNDLPDCIQRYPRLVPGLTNPASPRGVLNAMNVFTNKPENQKKLLKDIKKLSHSDICKFRTFLSKISQASENEKNLLRKLPLFETWVGSEERKSRFVSLQEVNRGAPADNGLPLVSVLIDLLDLRKRSSRDLAHLLGTSPMSNTDLLGIMLDDALKDKYSAKELDEIVKFIFNRFGMLSEMDAACLKEKLKRLSFVAYDSKSSTRKKPEELFDPNVKILSKIFLYEKVFPEEEYYAQPDVLFHLRKLGLKGKDRVTASDVYRCAKLVSQKKNMERATTKSKAILKLLEQTPSLLEEKVNSIPLKKCLDYTSWIPMITKKPESYPNGFPFKKSKAGSFACPKDVTSHEFVNLVGSVKLLVNTQDFSSVSEHFKWDQPPSPEDVMVHLKKVISAFEKNKGKEEFSARKAFEEIYSYFQERLLDTREEVVELLSPLNFILVEKRLLSAKQVVFSSHINYPPYLCQIPDDYKRRFRELFKSVGVRESFELNDYISTLKEIKYKYRKKVITKEFKKVKDILDLLAGVMEKGNVTATDAIKRYGSIFIPDSNGVMKPSTDVCIKDCYWMPDEQEVVYANEGIPTKVCITLGVNTRRQETLRKHEFGIPFGQKEKLTSRLKRILKGYPCDESILKELLQNADDAKATKICFINDPRQHPHERVFEERWKPLQGPALCVYNDAPFTESDIEGIQNLGEGNKGDDPNKTGQYGVGFNAVYHLTDAPTFISQGEEIGEVMCVFDPNLKFAPGADPSNPGVMYKDLARLREMFTDVFPCYLGEHFPLNNATMFRFPLRNEDMARTSKISNKAMTTETLDELLKDFKKELLQVLLFVNNVKEISICEINRKTGKLDKSYEVRSSLSKDDEKRRQNFAARVFDIGKRLQSGKMSVAEIPLHKVSYIMNVKDSKGLNQKWFIVQRIGFEKRERIPDNIEEAFRNGDLGLLPRAGAASLIRSSDKHEDHQGKAYCFLPLPFKTGLPVHINGHFALNHEDRRSLWRDDKGDYRSNWNDTLLRQVVAPCYVTLLDEVRQYISLPKNADGKTYITGNQREPILSNYLELFPSTKVQDRYWETLSKAVYCYIDAKSVRLLPVLRQENREKKPNKNKATIEWLPPTGKGHNQAFFDNLDEVLQDETEHIGGKRKAKELQKEEVLRDSLLAVGFNLLCTCVPMRVYKFFRASNVDVSHISPESVISFFKTYNTEEQLCKVGHLPLHIRDSQFKSINNLHEVLKYCRKDANFLQNLDGLPLLVTQDDVLQVFSQSNKVFLSEYYDLLPHCGSMFAHRTFLNSVFCCDDKVTVFKRFDIASFASQLPSELKSSRYKTKNRYVIWHTNNSSKHIPNKNWVHRLWKFLSTQTEEKIKDHDDGHRIAARHTLSQMRLEWDPRKDRSAKKRITQEALDLVKDWCLLPAFEAVSYKGSDNVQHVLVPLVMAETVIFLENAGFTTLKDSLKKLALPELNTSVIDGERDAKYSVIATRIVADLDDPQSVLSALLHKVESDPQTFKNLQAYDCNNVLSYFNDQLSLLDRVTSAENLKQLPLYLTIHDDIIKIKGKKAFVLSPGVPRDDMHIWEAHSGIVFLKENSILENLYKFLECHSKDNVDVYCDVIFEKFEDLSDEARLNHLVFVRELLTELENGRSARGELNMEKHVKKTKLSKALCKLKFIKANDGSLQTASSFYDPSNQVFKVMFEDKQEMFPPEPFCGEEWLPFLRGIGLIIEVSNEEFLKFAKEVELEAKRVVYDGTRRKSEALVTYLFKCANTATSQLLDHVKGIRFIFPYAVDRSLQRIYGQYGSQEKGSPCICFQGSVVSRNCSITWTSANLLPDYATPSRDNFSDTKVQKEIARRLGIFKMPSVDMVVTHCQNICNALYKRNFYKNGVQKKNKTRLQTKLVGIMASIYRYLDKNCDGHIKEINKLRKTRCIVVENGKQFVFPNQVVVEFTSEQEIRPYLYKIPPEIAAFAKLFENIGTTNNVTAAQYSNVLKSIHDESGEQKLHANEASKAFKATKGIFEIVLEDGVQDTKISPLYLPGVTHNPEDESLNMVFLKLSAELLYNNAPHFKERIKQFHNLVLVKLADCGLNVGNEELLVKKLPESIRPRMLTSVVHETLIEGSQPLSSSGTAQELRQTLTSNEFCHGLIRLIKHADHESDTETRSDILDVVRERLSYIQVYSIPNLQTRLVCNGRTIPGSEEDVSCFEEETEDGDEKMWNIYIEKGAELVKYSSKVAEIVDRITGHLLKKMLVHLPMMLSSKPYEINGLLDGLKIRDDDSLSTIQSTCLPTPGNFIHIADHHLLVDDFTTFGPGEYVGYELDDPSLRGEEGIPTYIYAIIIEEVIEKGQSTSSEPSSRRYRIDIGKDKEPIVVDAAVLYKFYRPNEGGSECAELEIYKGTEDEKPLNLDEVRKEVRRILRGTWKLSEEERKKITKRLFLKWHPDKNPGNEQLCTKIFQFIRSEIERLEKENRSDQTDFFSTFYDVWEKRAQRHRRQRSSFHAGDGFAKFPSGAHRQNPQPGEARRWCDQAKADLQAASNDVQYEKASYEWACFKCHQSAEKALKAAQYSIDADKTNVHNLRTIARNINNEHLSSLAAELESLVGDSTRMRYPDRMHYPSIPHDAYTEPMASKAMQLASSIIQEVASKFIN